MTTIENIPPIYSIEVGDRRSDVEQSKLGHFRVYFGQNGEWHKTYRVTDSLDRAKTFADDWVMKKGSASVLLGGL